MTVTLTLDARGVDRLAAVAGDICISLSALPGIGCAIAAIARHEVSGAKTAEVELRGEKPGGGFDAVMVIDGYNADLLRRQTDEILAQIAAHDLPARREDCCTYDLSYVMTAGETCDRTISQRTGA